VTTTRITLGDIVFEAFEVPEQIEFGGRQRMAIHDLPGGGRVIDLLGPTDSDLVFSGIFSGSGAGTRARSLDAMRAAGQPQPLSWDGNSYVVILADTVFSYAKPWWIPYQLRCVVQSNLRTATAGASVIGDLATAVAVIGGTVLLAGVEQAVSSPTALTFGTAGYAAALAALSVADDGVSTAMTAAAATLEDVDLTLSSSDGTGATVMASQATAGSLAGLAWGGAYLGRSFASLTNLGS
jgi:hypothetical protein